MLNYTQRVSFFNFAHMSLQIKGTVIKILNAESGVSRAGKEWKKQEFVIETQDQFPRKVCFTLFNDKVSLLDQIQEGKEVDVSFNVESREYNGRWFHNINAWKIDQVTDNSYNQEAPPEYRLEDIPPEPADGNSGDLPF